jgi:hypothetical protein
VTDQRVPEGSALSPVTRRRILTPLTGAAAALVLAVGAGAVADRLAPVAPRRAPVVRAPVAGGVWACPAVTIGAQAGYIALANASVEPSKVRVRIVRASQAATESRLTLAPGRATTMKVSAGTAPASAIVQWAGGEVIASHAAAVVTPGGRLVAAGASCSRTGDTTLVVPGLRTLARDAHVVLLNPSRADAVVDVSFLVNGDEQTPESLTSRVVPARGRLDVRAGDFVFDKQSVAAVVHVRTGTVVADGYVVGPQSAFMVPAAAPMRSGVAAGSPPFGAHVSVAPLGDEPSTVVSTTITPKGQHTTAKFPPALDPLTSSGVIFPERGALSVALAVRDGSPFVASLGWSVQQGGLGDVATVPFVAPAKRWLAVTQSPVAGWSAHIVLSNPGSQTIHARARLLTPRGQVASGDLASITLLPGRALAFPLESRNAVVGVEVIALDGEIGFALVAGGGPKATRFLYAISGASPQRGGGSVTVDQRVGIPARFED